MAAENEYTIQIGIDASPFTKGLQAMKDDIKEIQSLVKTSNGVLRDSFVVMGKSIKDISDGAVKNIKDIGKQAKALEDAAKPLRSILSKIDTKGIEGLDKALKALGSRFDELQKKAGKSKGIVSADDVEKAAGINEGVDKIIDALIRLQKTGTSTFEALNKSIDEFVKKVIDATAVMGGLVTESGKLEIPAAKEEPKKDDGIKTLENGLKVDTKATGVEATVAGISAVTDALGLASQAAKLFGKDGAELAKDMETLSNVLGFMQSALEIVGKLDKNSAENQKLRALFTKQQTVATAAEAAATGADAAAKGVDAAATETATAAQWSLNAAMEANPIGILLLAVTALFGAYEILAHTIGKASNEEQVRLGKINATAEAQKNAADTAAEEEAHINLLVATLRDEHATRQAKQNAIDELRDKYPELLSSLTVENALTETSLGLIDKQVDLIKKRALAQAAEEVYKDKLKAVIEAQADLTKELDENATKWNLFGDAGRKAVEHTILTSGLKKIKEATNDADGAMQAAIDIQASFREAMGQSTETANEYAKGLNFLTTVTDTYNSFAAKRPAVISPAAPQTQQQQTLFDPKQYEKDKNEALAAAQFKVDVSVKGTRAEIDARKNLLDEGYRQELKNQTLFNADGTAKTGDKYAQAIAIQGKYLADSRALNLEGLNLNLKDTQAAQEAISITAAAAGEKDSDKYVNARKKALTAASNAAIAQAGYDKDQVAKINAQLTVDLNNVDIERRKAHLDNEKAKINERLALAKEGSKEEYDAQIELLKNQNAAELEQQGLTQAAKDAINAQYLRKQNDLTKKYNLDVATHAIETEENNINARLALVKKGSEEELQLKLNLVNKQAELAKVNAVNTIHDDKQLQSAIALIDAKAVADRKDLQKDFFAGQIAKLEAYNQSVLGRNNAFLQTIVDDTTKSDKQRFEAKQQILQNEIDAIDKQIEDQKALADKDIENKQQYLNKINDLEAQKTQATSGMAQNALAFNPKFNAQDELFKGLGFNTNDPRQKEMIGNVLSSVSSAYEEITKGMEEKAQRQIDAIQKVIDATQEQIDQQEGIVEKEQELSDKGLANDLANQKKKLDDLKAKKDQEVKAREDAAKKLADIRKTEAAIQAAGVVASNIETAVNMVSAASKIFKSFSTIPFGVGIAIAVGVIASMYASFSAIKKAFSAGSEDTPKMRRGGGFLLDGPSHEDGGIGLYSGGRKLAEYEGDEYLFAINRSSTRKYLPLLEAINSDRLPAMQAILNSGRLPMDDVQQILVTHREAEDISIASGIQLHNRQFDSLKHLSHLPAIKDALTETKKELVDMGDYILEREGNRTRKIKKHV